MAENLKDTSEKLKYPNKSYEDLMIECYNSGEKVACKLLENRVNWLYISRYMLLSEGFIREYQGLVCWESISMHQALSKKFIREFKDKVEWYYISDKQILSEDFIREFKNKVDWSSISMSQVLTEPFIREFQDRVNWELIESFQVISSGFELGIIDIVSPKDNVSPINIFNDKTFNYIEL